MPSDALFGPSLSSERMREAVSDRSWIQAMLDVEAALAAVEATLQLIPASAAEAITGHCHADEFDIGAVGQEAVASANPVLPLVQSLRAKVVGIASAYVHQGATSQDILDTATMLIARRALALILEDLAAAAETAATLADRHRSTLMAARTLMQQATVTTFGLKAAGWLNAIVEAAHEVRRVRAHRLAVQLGGAVGTMASFGDRGPEVSRQLAALLELNDPVLPWHTSRGRVAELASTLALVAGVAGKVALDVILLAQTEVDEVRLQQAEGRGGSSAMPQKRNPVDAIEILAGVRGVNAQAGILIGAMVQEHERAAGAWQAEWPALAEAFRLTGGATARLAAMLASLQVDPERMRRNLELTGGLIMSEQLVMVLSEHLDPSTARALVEKAVTLAREKGRAFSDVVRSDPQLAQHLRPDEISRALDPANSLGASSVLIDRALAAYQSGFPGGQR